MKPICGHNRPNYCRANCQQCYFQHRWNVKTGKTTWEALEVAGKVLAAQKCRGHRGSLDHLFRGRK